MIEKLKNIDNKIARVFYYWIDSILGGFITELVILNSVSYSEAECKLFKGPRGKYLNSLKFWVKILLCEKGILRMHSY